jgi:Flp pilus assembly pilin Flp
METCNPFSEFASSYYMTTNLLHYWQKFCQEEDGQAVTEYGAALAFVALLVAMVFSFSQGQLAHAVQSAFSATTNQVNNVAAS